MYCGSSRGADPAFAQAARQLGTTLAQHHITLVYGGGAVGLMGVLADSVLQAGGEVIGVIPQLLVDRELAHRGITDLRITASMHERKALMAEYADAFLALPGGFGTADELFEMLTWRQIKIHSKPIGLLNVAGFFDPLLAWIDRAVEDGFIKASHRQLMHVAENAADLLDKLLEAE